MFLHHIPTDTTHRITHTYSGASDETYPHLSANGSVLVWEAKAHYGEPVVGSHGSNKDIWMTRLTYGCDDPTALNYHPGADIAECCRYTDATLDPLSPDFTGQLTLRMNLTEALANTFDVRQDEACAAYHRQILADMSCAMRLPANRWQSNHATGHTCAALGYTGPSSTPSDTITINLAIKAATSGPSVDHIADALLRQLKDARSAIWKGRLTRYAHEAVSTTGTGGVAFTLDMSNPLSRYTRGDVQRVTVPVGSGTRNSYWPKVAASNNLIMLYTDSDLAALGTADNSYHAMVLNFTTNPFTSLVPNQPANKDTQYPSSSADGRVICFQSNIANVHPQHIGSDQNQWWMST